MAHVTDLLKQLIAFDTTSHKSNLAIIEFIQHYLGEHGIEHHVIYNDDKTKANLVAIIGPKDVPGVVLSGHTDVVPVVGQDWDTDPFVLTEKDGRYYGRGTADMKSFLAVMLAMAPEFAKAKLTKPIGLAFSYDEEVGGLGAPSMVEFITNQGWQFELAIIGEPTGMQLVTSHKSAHYFETTVTGTPCHSSIPDAGINAIFYAHKLIAELGNIQTELSQATNDAFTPPYSTANVTKISGGTAGNIIPKHCTFLWDLRALPDLEPDTIKAKLDAYANKLIQEANQTSPHSTLTIETEKLVTLPSLPESGDESLEIARQISGCNHEVAVAFGTEAGIFKRQGNIPAIVYGPGHIDQAHQPNEFIEQEQIDRCMDAINRLLGWAAG